MNAGKYVKASRYVGLFILILNSERFDYYLRNSENSIYNSLLFSFVVFVIYSIVKSKMVNFLFLMSLNKFIKVCAVNKFNSFLNSKETCPLLIVKVSMYPSEMNLLV